eukprot:989702-Pleurochrysis_carterae.AAC.1
MTSADGWAHTSMSRYVELRGSNSPVAGACADRVRGCGAQGERAGGARGRHGRRRSWEHE